MNPELMEFFQDILNKIKKGAHKIILDEDADAGTNWIPLFFIDIEVVYFERF